MKLTGSYTFHGPREEVWAVLMDPDVLARSLPGVQKLEPVGDGQFEAVLNIGLAAVRGQYSGKVTISDQDPPAHYMMKVAGRGTAGFIQGQGLLDLIDQDATTVLQYQGDVTIAGTLAGVGQRLIEGAARTLIQQTLQSLDQELEARRQPPALPEGVPPVAPAPVIPWRRVALVGAGVTVAVAVSVAVIVAVGVGVVDRMALRAGSKTSRL